MARPGICIAVVLTYNNVALTSHAVESLQRQTRRLDRIIVVDNGSDNGSHTQLQGQFGATVDFLLLPANRGIAGGLNAGLRSAMRAGADQILVLLNDTELASDAVAILEETARGSPHIGAVAPLQVRFDDPDTIVTAGGTIERATWWVGHRYAYRPRHECSTTELFEADWLDYTCVLLSTTALERVGLLEERYRFYWDDVDWGLRARQNSFTLLIDPRAIVLHRVGGTLGTGSPETQYYMYRNRLLSRFLLTGTVHGISLLLREVGSNALAIVAGRSTRWSVRRRALLDFVLRAPYPVLGVSPKSS